MRSARYQRLEVCRRFGTDGRTLGDDAFLAPFGEFGLVFRREVGRDQLVPFPGADMVGDATIVVDDLKVSVIS